MNDTSVGFELLEALKSIMGLIDEEILVRDISKDSDARYFLKTGLKIARVLKQAQEAITKAEAKRDEL